MYESSSCESLRFDETVRDLTCIRALRRQRRNSTLPYSRKNLVAVEFCGRGSYPVQVILHGGCQSGQTPATSGSLPTSGAQYSMNARDTSLVPLMNSFGTCRVFAAIASRGTRAHSLMYASPWVLVRLIAIEVDVTPSAAARAACLPASRASLLSTALASGQQRWR